MYKSDWQPSSWLALVIASIPCFKWENVQPDYVKNRMPDLIQRLQEIASGNLPRTRGVVSRNYRSDPKPQMGRSIQPSTSTLGAMAQTRPELMSQQAKNSVFSTPIRKIRNFFSRQPKKDT
ncbi:unnamed protein product [Adineta steineri]|uniref:Uncharacterized protein n=1 Tax=Adineta steineri TaxID=433720 RepID=A0A814X0V5_9BILA|nr:unnamed protein product [Adineta steineri]CAF1444189.1 unnamed protein product [Adineta steineri]